MINGQQDGMFWLKTQLDHVKQLPFEPNPEIRNTKDRYFQLADQLYQLLKIMDIYKYQDDGEDIFDNLYDLTYNVIIKGFNFKGLIKE